jgi:hypothetical protein
VGSHHDQVFVDQELLVDGNEYVRCEFHHCTLVYHGDQDVTFQSCAVEDCTWRFAGSALRTLQFIHRFYHGFGEVGRAVVEDLFASLRKPPRSRDF